MKKNAMLKIAAILMVAVLLTTCAISSTFAKYTTSKTDTVTARVAKWGVTATTTASGMFTETYGTTVISSEKVVAPGTSSPDAYKITSTVSGSPEVALLVNVSAVVTLSGWVDNSGNLYCPLVFTNGTDTVEGIDYTDVAALQNAIADLISAENVEIAVSDTALNYKVLDQSLTWSWEYEVEDENGDIDTEIDAKDTFLGDLAADEDETNDPTITIAVTTTIDQAD